MVSLSVAPSVVDSWSGDVFAFSSFFFFFFKFLVLSMVADTCIFKLFIPSFFFLYFFIYFFDTGSLYISLGVLELTT